MTTSESKGRFFLQNESIRIDSHNESNRFESQIGMLYYLLRETLRFFRARSCIFLTTGQAEKKCYSLIIIIAR